jgi:hypothetical protein
VAVVRQQPGVSELPNQTFLDMVNQQLLAAQLTPLAAIIVAHGLDDFPTGVTGKVLKRELRTRLSGMLSSRDRSQAHAGNRMAGEAS